MRLCCTNSVGDSSCESSVVAGVDEQTEHTDLQELELARVQLGAQASRVADDPLVGRRLPAIAVRLVRPRHGVGCEADWQARATARLQRCCRSDLPDDEGPFRHGAATDDWLR